MYLLLCGLLLGADTLPFRLDAEGTCTGEHGVGVGKKEYLISELGEGTVGLMKTVKNAIDPLGIMNPGKVRKAANVRGCRTSSL